MPEVVSCAAPLSCPSPSCEAGLLPPSMQGEGDSVRTGPEGEGLPTREEGEEMQAKLITDMLASTYIGSNLYIGHVNFP